MKKAYAVVLVIFAIVAAYWFGTQQVSAPQQALPTPEPAVEMAAAQAVVPTATVRTAPPPLPTAKPTQRPTPKSTPRPTPRPSKDTIAGAAPTKDSVAAYAYIGNKNTKKFHKPSCSSVGQMNESNKVKLKNRQEAIDGGYVPCKRCNP